MRKWTMQLLSVAGVGLLFASAADWAEANMLPVHVQIDTYIISDGNLTQIGGFGFDPAAHSHGPGNFASLHQGAAPIDRTLDLDPCGGGIICKVSMKAENAAGAFDQPSSGVFGGDMPLIGEAVFYGSGGDAFFSLDLGFLGIESGEFHSITNAGIIAIDAYGDRWQTGRISADSGVAVSGYDARSKYGAGKLVLVTPGEVMLKMVGNRPIPIGSFSLLGVLTLTYGDPAAIPEPGTLLLFAAGIAGLALVGRRRMRSGRDA